MVDGQSRWAESPGREIGKRQEELGGCNKNRGVKEELWEVKEHWAGRYSGRRRTETEGVKPWLRGPKYLSEAAQLSPWPRRLAGHLRPMDIAENT